FATAGRAPSLEAMAADPNRLLLLGLGSTLGVVAQALLLLPFLLKTETRFLWWRFDLQDLAVKATMKLGSWTVGLVIANQVALFIILALAFGLGGNGEVSAYSYAWVFFQTPYAIISISVMSGMTPALSSAFAQGDLESYRTQFGKGLRSVLVIILPLSVLLFIVAKPLLQLLLGIHGNGAGQAVMAGHALAAFALGLPGFCTFQLVIRAYQTRHAGHQAFWLYLFENGLTIALAVLLVDHLGVTGLALANSIAYSVAALLGLLWLRSSTGRLGDAGVFRPLLRVSVASFVMGIVAIVGINVSASTSTGGLLVRLVVCGLGALAAYGLAVVVLAQYERGK
ncbi:MAG: lipid II flippase MurJ, partial [Actinomycetota bacterium]